MQATPKARRGARASVRVALAVAALAVGAAAAAAEEVNVYSYRQPQLIDPLLKAFTVKTGIKANVVYAADGLNERLAAEGRNSPAAVLLTVDAGRLSEAKDAGLTQPVQSAVRRVEVSSLPPAERGRSSRSKSILPIAPAHLNTVLLVLVMVLAFAVVLLALR